MIKEVEVHPDGSLTRRWGTRADDARVKRTVAVLEANPKATPADVEKGLQGNICRCGTYEQMRDAIYALCNQKRTN